MLVMYVSLVLGLPGLALVGSLDVGVGVYDWPFW